MKPTENFDYIILGGGAAGLSLAYRMANDQYFFDKKIALIEKDQKNKNDRTWCFWERGAGPFEEVIVKRWKKLNFYSKTLEKKLDIGDYEYKMISGLSFYNYTLPKIKAAENITYINAEVHSIDESGNEVVITTSSGDFKTPLIFKSYPSVGEIDKEKHLYVDQHFKGYVITTEDPAFNADEATFMDFRIPQEGDARFFYVLPVSPTKALVEVAIFSNQLLKNEEYDQILADYIKEYLRIETYEIDEEEFGVIPMTTFPYMDHNTDRIFHIGTGGGVVKPSSGYAFKRIQEHSDLIIECLKDQKPLSRSYDGLKGRFLLYDKVMLHAMLKNGVSGEEIFTKLFKKKDASLIFKFLNQKTHFFEELSVFTAPPMWPFTKSFFTLISR